MQWSDIQFDPTRRTLRQFAGLWLAFFGGMAAWQYFAEGRPTAALAFGVLALTIGPLGLAWPAAVRPIYVGWMVLAFPIGWTVSQVILGAMFYLVFTPLSLVFRLIGRDALGRSRRSNSASYWAPKPTPVDAKSYFNQF